MLRVIVAAALVIRVNSRVGFELTATLLLERYPAKTSSNASTLNHSVNGCHCRHTKH